MSKEKIIEVSNLCKSYGDKVILHNVNLDVYEGELVVIIGGSGKGKSVLLRQLIGVEKPSSGTIRFRGRDIHAPGFTKGTALNVPQYLGVELGYVPQSNALWNSMSNYDNLALMFREERHANKRVMDCLEKRLKFIQEDLDEKERDVIINLKQGLEKTETTWWKKRARDLAYKQAFEGQIEYIIENAIRAVCRPEEYRVFRYGVPHELSGGQKKRLAIARGMVTERKILFYDEPLTGLDQETTRQITDLIKKLNEEYGITTVMVSHDVPSTTYLNKKIGIIFDGELRVYENWDDLQEKGNNDLDTRKFFGLLVHTLDDQGPILRKKMEESLKLNKKYGIEE